MKIGVPTAFYTTSGGAYLCHFTNGLVVVNPGSVPVRLKLS
jgi:hypothetical protein